MSYAEEVTKSRRLAILLQLYFAQAYTAPLVFLRDQVERTGYPASLDLMSTDLAWLEEQGLTETNKHGAHVLTDRGLDVALGRTVTPGVSRPRPGQVGK